MNYLTTTTCFEILQSNLGAPLQLFFIVEEFEIKFGSNRACDPAPEQAATLPRPNHYIKININTTKEINLHRQNGTLQTRYFMMMYLVVVQGLTSYDAVLIESTSFMDEF